MKRLLPLFACGSILFGMGACGGGEETSVPPEPADPPIMAPADGPEDALDPAPDDPSGADMAGGGIRPAPGVYPFQGRWANDFSDCSLPAGSAETAPIEIVPGEMTGYENSCVLTDVIPVDEAAGRYEVARRCVSEGAPYEDVVIFDSDGDSMTMTTQNGGVTWVRCPPPGSSADE